MRRAYSLLEVVVAGAVLSIVLGVAATTILSGGDETRRLVQHAELSRKVGQTRDRIAHLVRFADSDSCFVQGDQLVFRETLIGIGTGTAGLSTRQRLGFAYTSDDPDNGLDDDGDGLIDEGSLFHVGDDGVLSTLIANVLEGSFRVELPTPTEELIIVRFQVGARARAGAGSFDRRPDALGVYPRQDGFLVISAEERIRPRN